MAALRFVLAGVIGAVVGFAIANLGFPADARPDVREGSAHSPAADPGAELALRIDQLTAELDTARAEEALLRAELARARASNTASESAAAETTSPGPLSVASRGPGRSIHSLAEAQGAYERAIAAGDLEALWLLGADILAFGEEGHPVFDRLLERFLIEMEQNAGVIEELWGEEDLWLGRFFRTLADEHEGFLAYGLTLAEREEADLGPALARVRREILDDELLPTLLAFHGGQNPELTGRWLDVFESRLALPDLGGADEEAIIFSLAHIPGDRAAELIIEWVATETGGLREDAIEALVLQGSPRALAALRDLLPAIDDEGLRAAIERRLAQ